MKDFSPTQSVNDSIAQIASIANTRHPMANEAMTCLKKLYTLSLCPINSEPCAIVIGLDDKLFMRYTHIMQAIMQARSTPASSPFLQDIEQALSQAINPTSIINRLANTALLFSRKQAPALSPTIEKFSQKLSLGPHHEKSD